MNVKSLLVIILALSIAVPTITLPMATTVTHAAAQPSVSIDMPVVANPTNGPVYRTLYISNPVSGQAITQISISIPTSMATGPVSTTAAATDVYTEGLASSATPSVSGVGPWAYTISGTTSTTTILPAGAAAYVEFGWDANTAGLTSSSTGAVSYTVTVTLTYASGSTQSFDVTIYYTTAIAYVITGVSPSSLGSTSGTLKAGQVGSFSVATQGTSGTLSGGAIPVFLIQNSNHGVISPSSLMTSSSGAAFTVNDTKASTYTITAYGGHLTFKTGSTGPYAETYSMTNGTYSLTIKPGPVSKVAVALPWDVSGVSTDYATNASTSVFTSSNYPNVSLTDAYNNAYYIKGNTTVTLTATAGKLYIPLNWLTSSPITGFEYKEISGNDTSTLSFSFIIPKGAGIASSYIIDFMYAPASTYGTMAQITGVLNGTYSGSSNKVITSTFESPSPQPTIYYKGTAQSSNFNAVAGKTLVAAVTLSPVQANVPVYFTITPSTVSASPMTRIAYTNKSGIAVFTFSDTRAGDQFYVQDYLFQPTTSNPTANESLSAKSYEVTIVPGSPASLRVSAPNIAQSSNGKYYISPLGNTLINVSLADAYGNPTTNTLGAAIQIQITTSAGSLSASTVYILQNEPGTTNSNYAVYFKAPNATGPVTITATSVQPGISSGILTLTVVNKYPMLGVTSPASGKVLTTQNITVKAWAAPSPSAPSGTFIAKFQYSLNGAKNVTVGITATNSSGYDFYSFPVTLASGLNTIKLYATDSQGLTSEYTVTYTLSTVPPTPAQTITYPTTPMQAKVAGFSVINVTMYNNVSTTLTATPIVVLSNSTYSWVAIGNPTSIAPGQTVVSFVSVQNIPAGTYTAKIFIVTPSGITISGYKTITVTIS